jgi:hypothetical protein
VMAAALQDTEPYVLPFQTKSKIWIDQSSVSKVMNMCTNSWRYEDDGWVGGFINISMAVSVRSLQLQPYTYIQVRKIIKYGYNPYMFWTLV